MRNGNILNRLGASPIGTWTIKHIFSPTQRWVYRLTGGRIFSTAGSGRNVLLLSTTGRRTGKLRTTPVFYLRDKESIIICNVNPGFEHTNPWVVNLQANPAVQVQIGRETRIYQARTATDTEVEVYWPQLIAIWPAYRIHYEHGGRRTIFVLNKSNH